ncbi:unnamed protein product [Brachionus calyciflorus]|uniref:Uncharacterized protein n=1 Tax=Brachionus calyciflorus TaxID=104777 RepID=A0A813SLK8_9BILA|nr:unnamed protein product [Brachionus calyciflorus]
MIKEFNRPNHSSIINQDLIAFKKVLKWASNIHKRLLKNINEIKSNKIDEKCQNEFTKLNECYESNYNFCLNVESQFKPKEKSSPKSNSSNQNRNIEIQKNQTLKKYCDKSEYQFLGINIPSPDSSTSQSDKTIPPNLSNEINIDSQNNLENVSIEIRIFEKLKTTMMKELTSQRIKVEELEEGTNNRFKETEVKFNKIESRVIGMESKVENLCRKLNELNNRIEYLSKKSQSNHHDQMEILTALLLKVNNK